VTGQDTVIFRDAEREDVPAIVALLAGCGLVQLTSDKQRPGAIRFYESLGFTATHEGLKLPLSR
jgi:hypothetical protein